jgi:sugar/nucleoside kinase (ribokinase family)
MPAEKPRRAVQSAADRECDCIVAGEANADLILQRVPALEWNKEKTFAGFDLILGGSSAITAFNLAKLGSRVSFVGVIGRDPLGDFVEARLTAASVDLSHLKRSNREKTGITIWHSNSKGQRAGLTHPGTIPLLKAADVTRDLLARARHLHVGHYFLLSRFHKHAARLFRTAKELGLTTSLDCNYDPEEKWDSGVRGVLRYTDIFFPNETEAKRLTGVESVDAAAKLLSKMARVVVVKLGAKGALVHAEGKTIRKPARKVHVVDTTGAGDSFNAGYLARFLAGGTVVQSLDAGIAAAARCVTRVGGTAAFE